MPPRLQSWSLAVIGSEPGDVLVGSTGVIGRRYPMERLRSHLRGLKMPKSADFGSVARAIMTTDTVPKLASARAGEATVLGIAKGSGMIEPDMATLLVYLVTDAAVPKEAMVETFRRTVDATFNSLSIDTDTSTSDSVLLLSNGAAGHVGDSGFRARARRRLPFADLATCR